MAIDDIFWNEKENSECPNSYCPTYKEYRICSSEDYMKCEVYEYEKEVAEFLARYYRNYGE